MDSNHFNQNEKIEPKKSKITISVLKSLFIALRELQIQFKKQIL